MSATAIIGAQFGSEGKGVVAAALAGRFDAAVRVGGPNAGHSFRVMDDTGDLRTYKMRGVPCAWVNPGCDLYIGAGAVVDPHLLSRELNDLPAHVRVYVDANAAVVTEEDVEAETHRGLRDAVGSTLEGPNPHTDCPRWALASVPRTLDAGELERPCPLPRYRKASPPAVAPDDEKGAPTSRSPWPSALTSPAKEIA